MAEDIRRSWLRHWHSVIDDAVGQDPSHDFEAVYKDPDRDFRMHFVTWDLPDESLRRCFKVLPRGNAMCNRAIEMRRLYRTNNPTMPEKEALELFRRGLDGFAQFVESADLRRSIRVVRGIRQQIDAQMSHADSVAILFEKIDWNVLLDAEFIKARSFLGETLYRLAHSYDVADYIDWPLFPDPQSIDPFRSFALLALSKEYYPLLDADGPVLFVIVK